MASAFYNMGNNLIMEQNYKDAKGMYMKSNDIFKRLLVGLYKEKGKEFKTEEDYECLKKPSAFDISDEILELKQMYKEMGETIVETEKSLKEYERMQAEKAK